MNPCHLRLMYFVQPRAPPRNSNPELLTPRITGREGPVRCKMAIAINARHRMEGVRNLHH